jgi:hypothetical protein
MLLPSAHLRIIAARRVSQPCLRSSPLGRITPPCSHALPTRQAWRVQNRGKRTNAAVRLDDLPQGVIPLEPLPFERDQGPVYPTVVQQARNHMRKFENCVLLTRVGGFYELYFEHAEELGPLLNLKVAQKEPRNAPAYSMVNTPASREMRWTDSGALVWFSFLSAGSIS